MGEDGGLIGGWEVLVPEMKVQMEVGIRRKCCRICGESCCSS